MSRRNILTPQRKNEIWNRFYPEVLRVFKNQTGFCRAYNIPKTTFSNWKARRVNIDWETLIAFCETEKVNIDYILTGRGVPAFPEKRSEAR